MSRVTASLCLVLAACSGFRDRSDGGTAGGTAGGSAGGTAGGSAGGTAGGSAGGTAGGSAVCSDGGFACDGTTGLCGPIPACSPSSPCGTLTTTLVVPRCRTNPDAGRPMFDDGPARTWSDSVNAEPRAACVYRPDGGTGLRPLVVFLHGSAGLASNVYDFTSLRQKAQSFALSDAGPPGFVLAASQGRNLANPNGNLGAEERHDIYFRDWSNNPDIRNLDRLVDELVAQGGIDPRRIYAMGWSNGAFFAQAWAIARHVTPTPGGHRLAGAVAFAGGDPFQNTSTTTTPSCADARLTGTQAPLFSIRRTCDSAVGCDAAQHAKFTQPPGYDIGAWIQRLRGALGNPNVREVLIDADGVQRQQCTAAGLCGQLVGLINHIRWPDGVADNGGRDWEPAMLEFLGAHPLP